MLELLIGNKNYSSWSLRPWVLMRELGIEFDELLIPFVAPGQPSPFADRSPTGLVPCLRDGDRTVWESLAIVEYLAEREPRVWPADVSARAWARCAAAEMHAGFRALRDVCGMNCGIRVELAEVPPALRKDLQRLDSLWGEGLARFGGPFLAGAAFSAVDAFFAPVAFRVQSYQPPLAAASRLYVDRLLALPAMRDWYAAALREPWRDAAHEAELQRAGRITQDLRTAAFRA
ncbi:MAG: glutathione S-transferase family protein [Lautropia sp.]